MELNPQKNNPMNDLKHKLTCLLSGMDGEPVASEYYQKGKEPQEYLEDSDKWDDAEEQAEVIDAMYKEKYDPVIKEAWVKGNQEKTRWYNPEDVADEYLSSLNL